MKAIGITRFGGPEVLQVLQLPDPLASEGEVRVRVRAVAVNPTDTLRRAGVRSLDLKPAPELAERGFPHVPGMEFAGIIDQIGPKTKTSFSLGDRVVGVIFPVGVRGAYSELVVLPVEAVVRIPEGVNEVAASTLPMNGLTAMVTLETLRLARGNRLGVTGAAGAYGGYVIQLAKAAGLWVVADAAEKDRGLVSSLGADAVVRRGDDVADRFLEVVPGGVDGLADGAVLNAKVLRAVRPGGKLVSVRNWSGDGSSERKVHPITVRHLVRDHDRLAELQGKLDQLRQLVERGQLTLRVARTLPADEAADAHRLLEGGGIRGRLVLTFDH